MRVLVLGGTGFIGSWIVRQLVAAGHSVRVLHRGGGAPDALVAGADYGVGNAPFSQICAIEFALGRGEPDCVIHVQAMTEADAVAAVSVLAGRTGRLVVLSSVDVYRAYGRFIRLEPGPVEPVPLDADRSALRERLFPYRKAGIAPATLAFDYDKIVVERAVRGGTVPWVILRLPKVYGAASNADLATVYGFASQPHWRWTHGYVENVAAGIVLAALHPDSVGRIYNLGEAETPSVGERLRMLPPAPDGVMDAVGGYDFSQDMVLDTRPIRVELGYAEPVGFAEGIMRTMRPGRTHHHGHYAHGP